MIATFKVNVSAPVERFEKMAQAAQNPMRILRRWSGYFRASAKRAADEQTGWPGWSEATRRKYEHTRTAKITAAGGVRAAAGARLEQQLRRRARQGSITAQSDLSELQRLRAGLMPDRSKVVSSRALEALRKGVERAAKTGKRVGGDRRAIARKKLLGRLPRMQRPEISGSTVKMVNMVPWSGVHNEGGTAGHGAREPARTWLDIDEQDRVVLVEIVRDSLLGGRR